jgi:hypothetical protein
VPSQILGRFRDNGNRALSIEHFVWQGMLFTCSNAAWVTAYDIAVRKEQSPVDDENRVILNSDVFCVSENMLLLLNSPTPNCRNTG